MILAENKYSFDFFTFLRFSLNLEKGTCPPHCTGLFNFNTDLYTKPTDILSCLIVPSGSR